MRHAILIIMIFIRRELAISIYNTTILLLSCRHAFHVRNTYIFNLTVYLYFCKLKYRCKNRIVEHRRFKMKFEPWPYIILYRHTAAYLEILHGGGY